MTQTAPLLETSLAELTLYRQGKVRDIYAFGDRLLIVATDRISAFDHVLGSGIPDKGKILTQLSAFWFAETADIVPNHYLSIDPADFPTPARSHAAVLAGRAMLVRLSDPLPIECVARGYLAGSGWREYRETGAVCGIQLPRGLRESDRLPDPIFTPATKATSGHDINITQEEAGALIGRELLSRVRDLTLRLYARGAAQAEARGIIIADTKFEFGLLRAGGSSEPELLLIDEVLTPDSSRFWPREQYAVGSSPPSFDKQFVRDYLDAIGWDRQPPVPSLPAEIVTRTREKYIEAFRLLTGRDLSSA